MKILKLSDIELLKFGHTIQAVGAVYMGEGQAFLVLFPESQDEDLPSMNRLDLSVEDWQKFLLQLDTLETEVTARASDGTIQKAIVRKSSRTIEGAVSWKVFRRDEYRCRYCGRNDVPLTVDHLVCWEEGGPSIEQNLVSSCKKCNKARGNTPFREWLKHPHYLKVSKALPANVREANERIVPTLEQIPRKNYISSR